jgi:hypothetical protein
MGGQAVRWVEEATVSTLRQPLCGVFLTPFPAQMHNDRWGKLGKIVKRDRSNSERNMPCLAAHLTQQA